MRRQRRQRLLRLVSGGEDRLADQKVSELAGKKVGITSAGSGSDICARWTLADHKLDFTRVPLGGGGLVPNLLTGNIDATVLYSPLTYKVIDEKVARPLIDFGAAIPAHSTASWIASDKIIKERPQVAAEGAQRHLRRRCLPARRRQPRRRRQADRRDRRDPGSHRRARARRQHQEAVERPARCSSTGWSARSTWRG